MSGAGSIAIDLLLAGSADVSSALSAKRETAFRGILAAQTTARLSARCGRDVRVPSSGLSLSLKLNQYQTSASLY